MIVKHLKNGAMLPLRRRSCRTRCSSSGYCVRPPRGSTAQAEVRGIQRDGATDVRDLIAHALQSQSSVLSCEGTVVGHCRGSVFRVISTSQPSMRLWHKAGSLATALPSKF